MGRSDIDLLQQYTLSSRANAKLVCWMSRFRHITPLHTILALASLILVLYLALPTQTYYWDGVLISLRIEQVQEARLPLSGLPHPNHLLYSLLGYFLYAACTVLGLKLRAIAVLQMLNAFVGVVAVCLVYRFAGRVTNSTPISLFCAMLFACGATWWKFSTDADSYILSATLLSASIYLVFENEARWGLAAACHALAMLFHELAILGYIPAVALFMVSRPFRPRRIVGYLLTSGLVVAAIYAIAYQAADHNQFPTLLSWISSSSPTSNFTHSFQQLITVNLLSYVKLFAGGRLSLVREQFSWIIGLSLAVSLTLFVYGLWLVRFRQERKAVPVVTIDRRLHILVWAWIIPYALFLSWFEPGNAFYKLFVWPPIVLGIGWLILSHRSLQSRVPAFLLLVLSLAAWNFGAFIYPHAQTDADPVLHLAKTIDRELPGSATIYYRVFSPDDWYLRYFAPGRTWLQAPADPTELERIAQRSTKPICLETTALDSTPLQTGSLRWRLLNNRHHVRLECLTAPKN